MAFKPGIELTRLSNLGAHELRGKKRGQKAGSFSSLQAGDLKLPDAGKEVGPQDFRSKTGLEEGGYKTMTIGV